MRFIAEAVPDEEQAPSDKQQEDSDIVDLILQLEDEQRQRQHADKPHLLVCNTDPSDKPGQHWVCIHVEDGHGEYFDSFGRRPTTLFERYLNRH